MRLDPEGPGFILMDFMTVWLLVWKSTGHSTGGGGGGGGGVKFV